MKIKIILLASSVLAIMGGAGSQVAQAATYPDATHAISDGKVVFTEAGPEIPDPEEPEIPILPIDPPNENVGDLMIQYVSSFDFGIHENSVKAFKGLAAADKVQKKNEDGTLGAEREVPAFVSTKDMRSERTGWELKVTPSKFLTVTSQKELKGAEVTLKGMVYNDADQTGIPTATTGDLTLSPTGTTAYSVAKAGVDKGVGAYSLSFGELNDKKEVTGVELNIPKKTAKNTTEAYKANFNWELVADPTA